VDVILRYIPSYSRYIHPRHLLKHRYIPTAAENSEELRQPGMNMIYILMKGFVSVDLYAYVSITRLLTDLRYTRLKIHKQIWAICRTVSCSLLQCIGKVNGISN
jgi:hypothetical protein